MKKTNKFLGLLISLCMLLSIVPTSVSAADAGTTFTTGDFTYTVIDATTVRLTSIAATKLSGAVTVPQTVSDGTSTYTVTQLGDAFKNQGTKTVEMTSLVLPDTITKFTGTAQFYACKGLTSIKLPANLTGDATGNGFLTNSFMFCSNLKSVELPVGIIKCYGTFRDSAVRTVTIKGTASVDFYAGSGTAAARAWSDGVTGITIYYPYNGTAPTRITGSFTATAVTYGNPTFTAGDFTYTINGTNTVTLTAIAAEKLTGAVTVPQTVSDGTTTYTVTGLGDAFKGTTTNVAAKTAEMTGLVLPDTITTFTGTATFYACKFTSIHLPASLTGTLTNTFQWCSNLKSVELPAGVTACYGTFQNSAVRTVTITGTVAVNFYADSTTAGARAWSDGVTGIKIYYPANGTAPTRWNGNYFSATVEQIGGSEPSVVDVFEVEDFKYKIITDTETVSVTGFSSTSDKSGAKTLPETVTYNDITYTVVSVGNDAFANQNGLTSFVMADTVTSVGVNIFYGCKNLTYVHLSDALTNTGASNQLVGTFQYCSALKTVIIPAGIKCLPKTFLNSGVENIVLKSKGTELPKGGTNQYVPVSNPDTVKIFYPSDGSVYGGYQTYIKNYFVYDGSIAYKVKDDNTFMVVSVLPGYTLEGNVEIPSAVGALKVTEIGANALEGCEEITGVVIPDSVVSIGSKAFAECTNLTDVTFSKNLQGELAETFKGCTGLETITIPEGITTLNGTFDGCSKLTSVKFANTVTTLSGNLFADCSMLSEITIPETVTQINDGTTFPDGCTLIVQENSEALRYAEANDIDYIVKSVVEYAIKNGNAEVSKTNFRIIGEYVIPATVVIDGAEYAVTSIADNAFADQDALTILKISDNIVSIGDTAFENCDNKDFAVRVNSATSAYAAIKSVNANYIVDDMASGLAYKKYASKAGLEIYSSANDSDLTGELTISAYDGKEIIAIAENAFDGQTGITKVTMADTIKSIGKSAFANCTDLKEAVLSAGAEGVLDSTFEGCESLENVDIPEGITALKNTYNGCSALLRVIIPDNITAIYANTFANCTNLETVVIPESVEIFDRIIGFKDETQAEAEYVETNTSKKWVDNPFKGATNENLAICGIRGSAAEEFAYSSGIKFIDITKGDYPLEYKKTSDTVFNVSIRDIYGLGDVTVIGALYDEYDRLLSCKPIPTEFDSENYNTVFNKNFTFTGYTSDKTLKFMVWNNLENFEPISNAVTYEEPEKIKILVLGNSISSHSPYTTVGWFAPESQGMAATSLDKDYVHVMLQKAQELNPNVEVKVTSVWSLESGFDKLDSLIASEYQEAVNYDADIIIAQFGENVKNNENEGSLGGNFDNENEFNGTVFANIVKSFMKDGKDVPVIAVSSMMGNKAVVLDAKEQGCEDNGWAYVNLCNDKNFAESKNSAYYLTPSQVEIGLANGTFKADVEIATGVYVHPGNNGMRAMAYGIWRYLEPIVEEMTFNN